MLFKVLTPLAAVFILEIALVDVASANYILTDLGTLGGEGSLANGINNTAQVIGQGHLSAGVDAFQPTHGFRWDGSGMVNLGTLGGTHSIATHINDKGQIVGYSNPAASISWHAATWNGATITDLGTLGGTDSMARGINYSGQVVGVSTITDNSASHALIAVNHPWRNFRLFTET